MTEYDIQPYLDFDAGYVWCRVTVTLRDTGEVRESVGDYLNAEAGMPVLRCGIEEMASDLGIDQLLDDESHTLAACDAVDQQLQRRTWALITCPTLTARLTLVPPRV